MFQGNTRIDESVAEYSVAVALAGAEREAGLSDFGDPSFEEPLTRLIEAGLQRAEIHTDRAPELQGHDPTLSRQPPAAAARSHAAPGDPG